MSIPARDAAREAMELLRVSYGHVIPSQTVHITDLTPLFNGLLELPLMTAEFLCNNHNAHKDYTDSDTNSRCHGTTINLVPRATRDSIALRRPACMTAQTPWLSDVACATHHIGGVRDALGMSLARLEDPLIRHARRVDGASSLALGVHGGDTAGEGLL